MRHAAQRVVVSLVAPLWVPFAVAYMRFVAGYRIRDLARLRQEFQSLREEAKGPLLLCANHLTLIDSFLIMWALCSPLRLLQDVNSFAWNTPDRANFAADPWTPISATSNATPGFVGDGVSLSALNRISCTRMASLCSQEACRLIELAAQTVHGPAVRELPALPKRRLLVIRAVPSCTAAWALNSCAGLSLNRNAIDIFAPML